MGDAPVRKAPGSPSPADHRGGCGHPGDGYGWWCHRPRRSVSGARPGRCPLRWFSAAWRFSHRHWICPIDRRGDVRNGVPDLRSHRIGCPPWSPRPASSSLPRYRQRYHCPSAAGWCPFGAGLHQCRNPDGGNGDDDADVLARSNPDLRRKRLRHPWSPARRPGAVSCQSSPRSYPLQGVIGIIEPPARAP